MMSATPHDVPELSFRKAGIDDVDRIVELVNSAYRGESSRVGWTTEAYLLGGQRTDRDEILGLIEASDSVILLCLQEDRIVGSVHLRKEGQGAYLGMLVVKPILQGAGLGKRIMAEAERRVQQEWGADRMRMTVITLRHELIAFYERRGYRRTGQRLPFPESPRFGIPQVDNLELEVLEKMLG
jgi:ribosomal protein S18 acetylase RimI-like enzyme